MKKIIMIVAAIAVTATCGAIDLAKENWKVPNWSTVVSAPGAVRFAWCFTPNWIYSRQTPMLPVQGIVQFGELKDGTFSDLTLYGGFNKYIER